MKRSIVVGSVLLTTVIVAVAAIGMRADAQGRVFADPRVVQTPDPLIFDGAGSSIGISVRDATGEELQKAKVNQSGGAFVVSVAEGGPGAKAGLRSGDLVTEFDGERVRSARQLTRLVRETVAGRAVKSSIVRDGSRQTVDITPENRTAYGPFAQIGPDLERQFRNLPRNFSLDINPNDFGGSFFAGFGRGRLGATLVPLGDQLAAYFGVKQGALVSSVDPDSSAAKAGLKAGDVITSINGKSVDQAVDVSDEVRRAQPGSSLDITVMRDKKEVKLKATVPESSRPRPAETRRSREV